MVSLLRDGRRFFGSVPSGSLCRVPAAGSRVGACGRGIFLASVVASSLVFSHGAAMAQEMTVANARVRALKTDFQNRKSALLASNGELTARVLALKAELESPVTGLEALNKAAKELKPRVKLFEEQLDDNLKGLSALAAKSAALSARLSDLMTTVGVSGANDEDPPGENDEDPAGANDEDPPGTLGLSDVRKGLLDGNRRINILKGKLARLANKVNNPNSGLASVNTKVTDVTTDVTALESQLRNPRSGLAAVHNELNRHEVRLGDLERTVNNDQSGVVKTREELDTHTDDLNDLKGMVEDSETGLANTLKKVRDNAATIELNDRNIESNRSSITLIQGRFGTMDGADSLALGGRSTSSGSKSVAVGYDATAEGEDSFSAGSGASVTAEATIALGKSSSATGARSISFGHGARASGADSSAMGSASSATGDGSVAFGNAASARGQNSVALGSNSVAEEDNVISVGSGPGGEAESVYRKIVNLADGVSDHDASTYGQLDSRVALEDRAYGAGGSVPTVVLRARQSGQGPSTSFSANAVEASVQRGDGKTVFLSENTHRKRTILSGGTATTTMVLADQDSVAGASSPGVMFSTTMYEGDGYGGLVERRATEPAYRAYRASGKLPRDQENVPAGATGISKSTDANGRAVYTYTTGARIGGVGYGKAPDEAINRAQLDTEIVARMRDSDLVYSGIASLAAVSNIPGLNPGQTKSIGVGAGAFNGSVAFAAGANFRFSDAFSMKASLGYSFDTKEASISGGLSYWW